MSDFDKEAEREKLREKYEKEEKKREATEQMSELLLKGATMTNAHCSDCGDPIFRYDGQEFCPTCEKPVDRGDEGTGEDGATGDGNVEVASPSDDATVKFGGQQADEATGEQPTDEQPTDGEATEPGQAAPDATQDQPRTAQDQQETTQDRPTEQTRTAPSLDPAASTRIDDERAAEQPTGSGEGTGPQPADGAAAASGAGDVTSHVANARASLARTAERFARAAETTDDPSLAREHLETAREAAAALDELD